MATTAGHFLLGIPLTSFSDDLQRTLFESLLWLTYRRGVTGLPDGGTSDAGWGCTIRSMQCCVANALLRSVVGGADVGLSPTTINAARDRIGALFIDWPSAPFGLPAFLSQASTGCRWFGPHEAAHVFARLCTAQPPCLSPHPDGRGGGANFRVVVCGAASFSVGDVEAAAAAAVVCADGTFSVGDVEAASVAASAVPPPSSPVNSESPPPPLSAWLHAVLAILPLRLGLESRLPEAHISPLLSIFSLRACAGGVGGRRGHCVFLLGEGQHGRLLCLDPHVVQDCPPPPAPAPSTSVSDAGDGDDDGKPAAVTATPAGNDDTTTADTRAAAASARFTSTLRYPVAQRGLPSLDARQLDPTIALAFLFTCRADLAEFEERAGQIVGGCLPSPLFTIVREAGERDPPGSSTPSVVQRIHSSPLGAGGSSTRDGRLTPDDYVGEGVASGLEGGGCGSGNSSNCEGGGVEGG